MKLDDRAIFISKMAPDPVKMLRQVISTQLEIDAAVLTDETDLFCLGLDSMGTMRIVSQLRQAGIPVKFSELFGKRNFAEWQQAVTGNQEPQSVGMAVIVDERAPFELATMQHAFWIGRSDSQPLGGVAAHFYTEFDGQLLDPTRLNRALVALIARHPQLRIRVTQDGKQQVLDRAYRTEIVIRDYRGKSPKEQAALLQQLRHDLSHQRLDVEQGSVFDISLTLLDNNRARLHFDLDMIAGDAVSLRIILRELAALYQDPNLRLPEIGLSYQQYLANVKVQRAEDRARDQAWWADHLATLAPPPNLPLRSESSESDTPAVTRYYHWLSPDDKARLHALSKQYGLTMPAVLATAFTEVVGAWRGGERFLLNLPVFNRQSEHEDIDRIIGDFSSSVLLTVEPSTVDSFTEQAHILQQELHTAAAHMAYSGVEVLRDLSRLNDGEKFLAPVVFTSALELGDLYEPIVQQTFGEPAWSISQGPQVWLDAQVTEHSSGILLNWDVRESVFIEDVVSAMFDAFRAVVECLLEDERNWSLPFTALCLDMGAPRLVAEKDNRRGTAPVSALLYQRFFDQAARNPSAAALILGGQSALSYGELAQKALRVAGFLRAEGIGPGQSVAITMPKGNEQIVATLGVLAAGATYVPSGIDLPSIRRQQVYETAGIALVLAGSDRALWPEWPDKVRVVSIENVLQARPLVAPVIADADAPMYVIFTSGSTGTPKGVEVSHRSVANTIDAVNKLFEIGPQDSTLTLSELDFDLSAYDLFAFLSCGASVVVVEEHQRRDAPAWVELMNRWNITVISCVPAILDMILVVAEGKTLPHWRLVMLGGDRISRDLPPRFQKVAPGARFVGLGGMTEAAIHSTVFEVHDLDDDWTSVPFGKPLKNMRCRMVDRLGRDCPYWVTGELWVSGPGVAIGYRNDPHRTAERFVYLDGHRWYRTGDLVRQRADNNLEFLGRADNQVKIRGHRIELGEVEAAVAGHQAVDKAFVTVINLSSARQLSAVVTLNQACDIDSLRVWASERLPHYSVPEHYLSIDSFPLTYNGKIDRKRLQKLAEETAGSSRRVVVPPQGRMEQIVAKLWRELLNMSEISRDDSFFVCGGDSLIATRLISRLAQEGVRGHLAQLFSEPTLAVFSATLSFEQDVVESEIEADLAHRFDPFPLTDIQQAYWIGRSRNMELGNIATHFYCEIEGDHLNIEALNLAWQLVIERHEMLKAVVLSDGQQKILKQVPPYRFDVIDLREKKQEAVEAELRAIRREMSHQVLPADRWPLFDIRASQLGESHIRLHISFDSLIVDVWSVLSLMTDWYHFYQNDSGSLPPLDLSFRDYVLAETALRDSEPYLRDQEYWFNRLPSLPPAPELPLARDPGSINQPRFNRRSFTLVTEVWQNLKSQATQNGLTPSGLLIAAYANILRAWSKSPRFTINLTLSNRSPLHPQVNDIVGDFTSLTLLAVDNLEEETFATRASQLQQQLWRDMDHRYFGGMRVLREMARLRGEFNRSAMPVVFTSALNMESLGRGDSGLNKLGELVYSISQTPQVWLDHQVYEQDGDLILTWDAVEELFPEGLLDDMFDTYCHFLKRLADEEEAWNETTHQLIPASQLEKRAKVNTTEAPISSEMLHTLFANHVLQQPDHLAVISSNRTLSYDELFNHSNRVGRLLREKGAQPNTLVAVVMEKGWEQVVAVLGILNSGAAYLPIDPTVPKKRFWHLLEDGEVGLVLTQSRLDEKLEWPEGIQRFPLDKMELTDRSITPLEPVQRPDDLAYVIYTSGSTGLPKGVMIDHRGAVNTILDVNRRFGVGSEDKVLALSNLNFDLSVYDIFGTLAAGGTIVLPDAGKTKEPAHWLELMRQEQVTIWNSVPALMQMLVEYASGRTEVVPQSLHLVLLSGDWIPLNLPDKIKALKDGVQVISLGGATEASIWSNLYPIEEVDPDWKSIPYGRPMVNQRFYVLNEFTEDCPDWVPGQLYIGGIGLAKGYWRDQGKTKDSFIVHPRTGERLYRTGDLGRYLPDANIEFLGREDFQVKIRGYRIELGEIEAALETSPEVQDAVVITEGEPPSLAAAVVLHADSSKTENETGEELRAFLATQLPGYMVPNKIIVLNALPLNANGKVDRTTIGQTLKQRQITSISEISEPPRDALEQQIARIWTDILQIQELSRNDDFFLHGGDSLKATRIIGQLRTQQVASREISLRTLFAAPTVATLAEQIRIQWSKQAAEQESQHQDFEEGIL